MFNIMCTMDVSSDTSSVVNGRGKLIKGKLMWAYAYNVCCQIHKFVANVCKECAIHYPAQRDHDCMRMLYDQRVWLYFYRALEFVSDADIMIRFLGELHNVHPEVNALEMLKYTCKDWREEFCIQNRDALASLAFEFIDIWGENFYFFWFKK